MVISRLLVEIAERDFPQEDVFLVLFHLHEYKTPKVKGKGHIFGSYCMKTKLIPKI